MEKTTRRLPIVERDEWLLPAEQELNRRYERYTDKINAIEQAAGSIVDYANGYRYFGWQRDELLDGWWLREWLPGAHDVYVFGDFNNWQRTEIRMQRDAHGVWSAFFPEAMYRDRLRHGSLYKLHVHGDNGWKDRIPAYATRVVQDEATKNYTAQFWAPEPFDWQGDAFDASKNGSLMIYEAHVGMAQEKEGVGTYREFTEKILPIIKKDGYNAVQLMAIAEHPYYGSFGYHVSSFFAPASRCGTPEELKELVESPDDANKSYTEFKKLQQQWNEVKLVPQAKVNELWKNYQLYVEKFYDLLKLNNEFREYDFKKNLEIKTHLCEAAEKLADEADVVSAFHQLQKLHQEFRDTGPVAKELRDEIWARFKAASTTVNRRHQQHFEALKEVEQHNLDQKTVICEIIEAIDYKELTNFASWESKTQEVIALQNKWKTIGFAPQKMNVKIFERFRKACDEFFRKKGEFFKTLKEGMNENLEKKRALCEKAEALKDSTDWKVTADELTKLQKEWKTIGPVAKKYSDAVWKRFISACDYFFEQKNKATSSQRSVEQENLEKKKNIIEKLNAIDDQMDTEGATQLVRDLMKEWNGVGHVPFKEKDRIYKQYHSQIDKLFERFNISASNKKLSNFKSTISSIQEGSPQALYREREKLVRAFDNMKNELQTYENNLGFLTTSSKKGNSLLTEINRKVEKLKADIELVKEKIKVVDENIKNQG